MDKDLLISSIICFLLGILYFILALNNLWINEKDNIILTIVFLSGTILFLCGIGGKNAIGNS